MRSARLLVVGALAVLLALSLFSPVAAQYPVGITVMKVTTNGDTATAFAFHYSSPVWVWDYALPGGGYSFVPLDRPNDYTITETVPNGWLPASVNCVGATIAPSYISNGVTVHFRTGDAVVCTFTNSPAPIEPVLTPIVPTPAELCVIQWGVEEQNGAVSWWPGFAYLDVPISQCQDKTDYFTDVLDRTIVIHQFNQTRMA